MKTLIQPLRVLVPAAVLLLLATLAASGADRRENSERLKQFLGLSEAQVTAIDQETANLEKALQPHMLRMTQIHQQTELAVQSGNASTIGQAVLDQADIAKQIDAERKASQEHIRAILTPQQLDKLNQAIEILRYAHADASFLGPLAVGAVEPNEIREHLGKEYSSEQARRPSGEIRGAGVPGGRKPPR